MANDINASQFFKDLSANYQSAEPAAEEFRQSLNAIIGRYRIHPAVVLSLLARLTAAYIHMTQKMYNETHADVVVEEDFQQLLTAQLTDLDMTDVLGEIDKMKKEKLN